MEKSELMVHPREVRGVLARHILADGLDLVFDLKNSRGCHLYDAGREAYYLDFFGCYATIPLGYNHPRMTTPEAIEELGWAAVQKPTNSDVYSQPMAEFVETFGRIGIPESMPHTFFIEGGALAVENALKAAFDWKVRKNLAAGKGERGTQVIHFRQAFHGRSGYTLSLTNTADPRKTQYFPKFDWPRIDNPKVTFPLEGANLEEARRLEREALGQIEQVLREKGDDIACLILEPIQSEGGDNHFRLEFHQALRRICDEHDVMFVYDEVQTGFGASGKFWAFQHYVEPDIVCFGKKSQVCGILVGRRIEEAPEHVFHTSSRLNSTWGGNLVDMVRSRMHLEIYEREGIVAHVERMGRLLLDELRQLAADHPDKVQNPRGLGLLCAFDLPSTELRNQLRKDLFERKLIILGCGQRSIRFRTALNIPEEDLRRGLQVIREAIRAL